MSSSVRSEVILISLYIFSSGPWVTFYNPLQTYSAEWVVHVINWAKVHLDPRYANDYGIHSGLEIDFDTMFLGAQSSGSHVAINYLALQQQQVSIRSMMVRIHIV